MLRRFGGLGAGNTALMSKKPDAKTGIVARL